MMPQTPKSAKFADFTLIRLKKIYMRMIAIAIIAISGIGLMAQVITITGRGDALTIPPLAPTVVLMLLGGLVLLMIDQGHVQLSARFLIYGTIAASILACYTSANNPRDLLNLFLIGPYVVVGTLAIVTTALLGTRLEHYLGMSIVLISAVLATISVYPRLDTAVEQNVLLRTSIVILLTQALVGGSLRFFVGTMQEDHQNTRRANQLLEASAMVGQVIAQYLNADELYQQTVDIIRERFGYSQVQIYTLDEDALQGKLRASTRQTTDPVSSQRRLSFSPQSLIGRVVRLHDAVVIEQNSFSEIRYSELLPDTQSAFMAPLLDNERVIGVLDVQSTEANTFSQAEQQALKVLASQLATAIRNAVLFEQQQQSVRENQRLLAESENSLVEIRRLNSTLTREAWEKYMFGREQFTGISLSEKGFNTQIKWTDTMIESVKEQQPIVKKRDDQRVIAMPMLLRGETIGAIEIEIPPSDSQIELELVDIIEGVAQRLAISLDNARLFEEIQEASFNEQIISGMVTEFQSASTIESLLKTALEGLSSSLGARSGAIRMKQTPINANYARQQPFMPVTEEDKPNGHANGQTNGHQHATSSHHNTDGGMA